MAFAYEQAAIAKLQMILEESGIYGTEKASAYAYAINHGKVAQFQSTQMDQRLCWVAQRRLYPLQMQTLHWHENTGKPKAEARRYIILCQARAQRAIRY